MRLWGPNHQTQTPQAVHKGTPWRLFTENSDEGMPISPETQIKT